MVHPVLSLSTGAPSVSIAHYALWCKGRQCPLGWSPMTSAQLRRALQRLRISQMELSRRLRVAPSTVRRWIAGRTPIPEAVALLLKEWIAKR